MKAQFPAERKEVPRLLAAVLVVKKAARHLIRARLDEQRTLFLHRLGLVFRLP